LWTAATISYLGDGIYAAALPLLAASLTSNAALVGLAGSIGSLAWVFFGLIGGTLVDRWDRLRTMWLVDLGRFMIVAALAAAVAAGYGSIPLLLAVVLLLGVGQTLFDTASQAVIPLLVTERGQLLEDANGRLSVSQTAGEQFAGPPVGGFLFGLAAAMPLAANAASFALSSLIVRLLVRRRNGARPAAPRTARPTGRSLTAEIAEGLRWMFRQRVMVVLAVTVGMTNLAYTASSAIFVLYVHRELHLGSFGYGLLLTATAAGAVLGGFTAVKVSRALGPARTLTVALAMAAASRIGLGLFPQVIPAVGCLLAAGWGLTVFAVIAISLRQRMVPDRLRGRVLSAYRLIALGPEPVGGVLGGLLANRAGLRAAFLIGGVLIMALAGATLLMVSDRAIRAAEADAAEVTCRSQA
jgi:MFS family permease